eukprot:EG_transcript_5814
MAPYHAVTGPVAALLLLGGSCLMLAGRVELYAAAAPAMPTAARAVGTAGAVGLPPGLPRSAIALRPGTVDGDAPPQPSARLNSPALVLAAALSCVAAAGAAVLARLGTRRPAVRLAPQWAMMATTGADVDPLLPTGPNAEAQLEAVHQFVSAAVKSSQAAAEVTAQAFQTVKSAVEAVDVDQLRETAAKTAKVIQPVAEVVAQKVEVAAAATVEAIKSFDYDQAYRTLNASAVQVNRSVVTPLYQSLSTEATKVASDPAVTSAVGRGLTALHTQAQALRDQLPLAAQPYLPDEAVAAGGVVLVLGVVISASALIGSLPVDAEAGEWDVSPEQADVLLRQSNAVLLDIRTEADAALGVPDLRQAARGKAVVAGRLALAPAVRRRTPDPDAVEEQLHLMTVLNLKPVQRATAVIVMDRSGSRGRAFARLLRENGLPLVYYVRGGYNRWARSGLGTRDSYGVDVTDLIKEELASLVTSDNVVGRVNSFINSEKGKLTFGLSAGLTAMLLVSSGLLAA